MAPSPPQTVHGVSAILPSPPQVGQGVARTICPKGVRVACRTCPAPPQVPQVVIGVPGSAPLPWQCSQRTTARKATSRLTPVSTSASSISSRTATSPPAAGPAGPPRPNRSSNGDPPAPPPKNASKMSWKPPALSVRE